MLLLEIWFIFLLMLNMASSMCKMNHSFTYQRQLQRLIMQNYMIKANYGLKTTNLRYLHAHIDKKPLKP